MKTMKNLAILVLGVVLMATTACNSEPSIKSALGEYNYRLSGTARIYDQDTDEAVQVTLEAETGTLKVVRGNEPNTGIMTVYADQGSTYELPLLFAHDTVWVEGPQDTYRDIEVTVNGQKELFHIRIGGQGFVLNNGDLTIHLGYTGRCRDTSKSLILTAGDVHMNAKKQ